MTSDAPSTPVRALSVRQPWATLIISGRKTIELRTWETGYRGRVWIHAAAAVNESMESRFGIVSPPRGAFLGLVDLVTIVSIDSDRWAEWRDVHLDPGQYTPGYFGWVFSDPEQLARPVPARGHPGLYAIGTDQAIRMLEQMQPRPDQTTNK
jgi:hypothetical protein